MGPDCNIPCVNGQGKFVDPKDGTDERFPIRPVFACVEQSVDGYTAWFNYINDNGNNIYISARGENTMVGIDFGSPPTKFEQGDVSYTFSVG